MAQVMVNFRMDEDLKRNMEQTCKEMGLTLTSAFTMFAIKVTKEQRIPFEVVATPINSKVNMERAVADAEVDMADHRLIEG